MKKSYLILNSILVIIILGLVFIIPDSENMKASTSTLSKSLTTSILNSTMKEEVVYDETTIDEVVDNFSNKVNSNITDATLITDVLETVVGTMSGYGLDCKGCSGRVGARYDARGNNVRYNDPVYGECRIVAGDKKYPYGTIIRVKDSKIGTFNAIVLDRGGDIGIGRRYMFDLLFYTEKESYEFGLSRNTTFEVLRYGY
ncbi:MAG: hypothetical protein IJ097_01510 [Bacilli bacterium]|nr:hypothetical protein [Bacilli bacterium]